MYPEDGDPTPHPTVLSISLGSAEFAGDDHLTWSPAAIQAVTECFAEAAARGMTVLVASGDQGSSCGVASSPARARILYPASDPWVTGCGGTIFDATGAELSWPNTGGGVSDYFDVPDWQKPVAIPSANPDRRAGRGVPDIAGYAGGYAVLMGGKTYPATYAAGTSGVAPLYAAMIAIINAHLARPVGYLNPLLYRHRGSELVRDVSGGKTNASGGAPGYAPGPGWDACTGLGTIDGTALLNALRNDATS